MTKNTFHHCMHDGVQKKIDPTCVSLMSKILVAIYRAEKILVPKEPKNTRLFKAPKSDEVTMEFFFGALNSLPFFGALNLRLDAKTPNMQQQKVLFLNVRSVTSTLPSSKELVSKKKLGP